MYDHYGPSYVQIVGIYRPYDGCGSCTSYAMNSDAMASYYSDTAFTDIGWTSIANVPEPWFMRATAYSEPNGDYTANCWLGNFAWLDGEGFTFNDASCGECSSQYLYSPDYCPSPCTRNPSEREPLAHPQLALHFNTRTTPRFSRSNDPPRP